MVNLLKSVCCRNLLKHAKDEKSSDVAGRLFELCITRFEKKYIRTAEYRLTFWQESHDDNVINKAFCIQFLRIIPQLNSVGQTQLVQSSYTKAESALLLFGAHNQT